MVEDYIWYINALTKLVIYDKEILEGIWKAF